MFHFISGIIGLYIVWRFIELLPLSRLSKWLYTAIVLLVAEHHLITRNFFGSMASPEIPFILLIVLGWAFGTLLLLFFFLLTLDSVSVIFSALFSYPKHVLLKAWSLRCGLALVAALLSVIGVWQAVRVPDIKTIEIVLPRMPPALDGFRIVQLTDLHASKLLQERWIASVVDKANALHPDLMVITGDLVDGSPQARTNDIQPLGRLKAKYGVYAIPGNHEYYTDYVSWLATFEQLGLTMLINQHATIMHNGESIIIAGITDPVAETFEQEKPDVARALHGASKNWPIILMSHRPLGALMNAQAGVDLQLSGHTHGGQILGPHLFTQWVNEGYVSGLYQVDSLQLYVSNGTGLWSGLPIRLGRPSEITQLVLRVGHPAKFNVISKG